MIIKITLLNDSFHTEINNSNYELALIKLKSEKDKINNLLRNYQKKGLIKSINKPVDKTLICERGIKSAFSFRRKKSNTELQNSLDRLIKTLKNV